MSSLHQNIYCSKHDQLMKNSTNVPHMQGHRLNYLRKHKLRAVESAMASSSNLCHFNFVLPIASLYMICEELVMRTWHLS
jgi:hypothetical protein